jgi:hypothetical protein
MALGPGFEIKNCTQWPLTISLDQLGPLYYGLVQPGEMFVRDTGAVWFTIKVVVSPDNESHISDWDCIIPVAAVVGAVVLAAITGGGSAFIAVGQSVGASALVSGGAVSLSGIVAEAAVGGAVSYAIAPATAIKVLGDIFSQNGGARRYGCYAGPPWPLREDRKQFSVTGGPTASLAPDGSGKLLLSKGTPMQIVDGLLPTPAKNPTLFQWETMPGTLKAMTMIRHSLMVGIGPDDRTASWDGTKWTPSPLADKLQDISAGHDGAVWGIIGNTPNRYDAAGRRWIPMQIPPGENDSGVNASRVVVRNTSEVFALLRLSQGNISGNIRRWTANDPTGTSGSWENFGGNTRLTYLSASDCDGTLLGLDQHGAVLRYIRQSKQLATSI